jgi:hypothetical protein
MSIGKPLANMIGQMANAGSDPAKLAAIAKDAIANGVPREHAQAEYRWRIGK